MINGSRSEGYTSNGSYVTRDEFRPLVDRVNVIAEEHAEHRVHLANQSERMQSMDKSLQNISQGMDNLVKDKIVNDQLKKFTAKCAGWTFAACVTMVTANFTGIIHLLNKALS